MAKKKQQQASTQAKIKFGNPKELERVRTAAKATGRSLAAFLRLAAIEAAEKVEGGGKL